MDSIRTTILAEGLEKLLKQHVARVGSAYLAKLAKEGVLNSIILALHSDSDIKVSNSDPRIASIVRWITSEEDVLHRCLFRSLSLRAQEIDRDTFERILTDPYHEISFECIGFVKADQIALRLGVQHDIRRVPAALCYCLYQAKTEGHCYLDVDLLRRKVIGFGFDQDEITTGYKLGIENGLLYEHKHRGKCSVYRKTVRIQEEDVATFIAKAAGEDCSLATPLEDIRSAVSSVASDEQVRAIHEMLRKKACVLTGPPGSGKSRTIGWLSNLIKSKGKKIVLLAPTGRAASRLKELDAGNCITIHSWLMQRKPCPDVVFVDETSMVDLELMCRLVNKLKMSSKTPKLILCGDVEQLPSIGPGNVLFDVIDSGIVPVAKLSEIRRQSEGSSVSQLARYILNEDANGIRNVVRGKLLSKGVSIKLYSEETALSADVMKAALANPEAQILVPCNGGALGADGLNNELQKLLNPNIQKSPIVKLLHCHLALNDKVIMCKNDTKREICNGDIGFVSKITAHSVEIEYRAIGRTIQYKLTDESLLDLKLAYAITIHRTQGSEFAHVLIVLPDRAWIMARKSLLYTAVTRAKRTCEILGRKEVLQRAVTTTGPRRNTFLAELIRSM